MQFKGPFLAKTDLKDGHYYEGRCRNATIARWSAEGNAFYHWRTKFTMEFIESIRHPEDDKVYDVFYPIKDVTDKQEEMGYKDVYIQPWQPKEKT